MNRAADEIGRGLAPTRSARPIAQGERIHVVGAAGAGGSAAVLLAHYARAAVTGCDSGGSSPYTRAAEELGISLAWRHDPAHIAVDGRAAVDRVGVTKALTAVDPDHAELRAARDAGVPVEAWQQVVADAAVTHGGRLVAVAGTHGKSTVSGWLVHVLTHAGRDPGAFVGALLPAELAGGIPATARWGRGDTFVVEADEYAGNFDAYRPSIAVLLNAEWDHPDVFPDEAAVLDAFESWIRRMQPSRDGKPPVLVANVGNSGVARLTQRLTDWHGLLFAVALVEPSDYRAADNALPRDYFTARESAWSVLGTMASGGRLRIGNLDSSEAGEIQLPLAGRHNVENALSVAAAGVILGLKTSEILRGLESFRGVGRRLELKGEVGDVAVLDDYGHHPTAIRVSLQALRERYGGRRIWAVYEPLTYHRTAAMLDQFADVLATADRVAIADIWAGRDPDTTMVSAADLAKAVNARDGARADAPGSVESTADYLANAVEPGDVVLVMGGGRSYVIADRLVELLRRRDSQRGDTRG